MSPTINMDDEDVVSPYRRLRAEDIEAPRKLGLQVNGRSFVGENGTKIAQATILSPQPAEDGNAVVDEYFHERESSFGLGIMLQVFPPFFVAGLGMVAAGLLLGVVHQWPVFLEVREILILVPALLGLKGNLEMTLASRISTHANLGDLDDRNTPLFWEILNGNFAVVQAQAIVVGILAACVAVVMDMVTTGHFHGWDHVALMAAASVTAASVASFILAIIMVGIVLFARSHGINPDNVASPIAGMLGDFCTLAMLSGVATVMWDLMPSYGMFMLVLCYMCAAPGFAWFAYKCEPTKSVLREGWTPVIASMCISSCGGLVLKHAVSQFHLLAPFAPVMNGAGGNLAAVHASRLSTDLHATSMSEEHTVSFMPGSSGSDGSALARWWPAICGRGSQAQAARMLAFAVMPGAACFASLIVGVRSHWAGTPDPYFLAVFVVAAYFQVLVLLTMAHFIVGYVWLRGLDPDNVAIPYVTATGDVVGTTCLTVAFWILYYVFERQPWTT
eukprot:TRINITY_DN80461_c0_g1_i1.p1 TRINITY_DN80461_c0_g1~~TRINITY_DN80461_c0_g1_i1.p1  ORF type:complete len:517 (-),score=70.32 TRINITY_DN80461_c0_g1_i1:226-1734(-)